MDGCEPEGAHFRVSLSRGSTRDCLRNPLRERFLSLWKKESLQREVYERTIKGEPVSLVRRADPS